MKATFRRVRFLTAEGELSSYDSQKKKVYEAERQFWDKTFATLGYRGSEEGFMPKDPVQGRTEEAVAFIRRHIDNQAMVAAWNAQTFYVAQPKPTERSLAGGRASKRRGRVYIGGNAPFWVLVHEIAHVIAPQGARHNWPFVLCYLELVRAVYGVKVYKALRTSFRKGKVRYAPKRRRAVSPERLERLKAAARKAREGKAALQMLNGPRLPSINI